MATKRKTTALIETPSDTELTADDRKDFRIRHARVKKNFSAFIQTAEDLYVIRQKRSYRTLNGYKTFEDYCKAEFDVTRQHGLRLADAGEVVMEIKNVTHGLHLPDNERQVRPFQHVPQGEAATVWKDVVDIATKENVVITGAFVKKVVDKHYPPEPKAKKKSKASRDWNGDLGELLVRIANEVTTKDFAACSDDTLQSLAEKLHAALSARAN